MKARFNLQVGAWYVPTRRGHWPRWVLAAQHAAGLTHLMVVYSRGGEHHFECQFNTFRRWVRRARCKVHNRGGQSWPTHSYRP